MSPDDEYEDYEPSWEEIEALLEAEQTFREENDLVDDAAWDAYCLDRARDWLAEQEDDPRLAPLEERARAFMLGEIHRHIQATKQATGDSVRPHALRAAARRLTVSRSRRRWGTAWR